MRGIKFRAWDDTPEEEWMYLFDPDDYRMETGNEKLGQFLTEYFGCELMQYTGLTDKNGTDIYEGDIVKANLRNFDTPIVDRDMVGDVSFQEFEYCINTTDDNWPVASWKCVISCEVIGNIHQNPELLENNNG